MKEEDLVMLPEANLPMSDTDAKGGIESLRSMSIPRICACAAGKRMEILGVPVDQLSGREALHTLEMFLRCGHTHVINHLSVDPIVQAIDDTELNEILRQADLNLADGMGVVWAARLLGANGIKQRVYGPDFMRQILAWGCDRGISHAFVGGNPQLLQALRFRLEEEFPEMKWAGSYPPPVREVTKESVAEDVRALGMSADLLWVGLGTPKQQRWAEWARRHHPAKVILTVGAAFDFLSGSKAQAPSWVQRSGTEWLFRMAMEPRRLWRRYLLGNPKFVRAVAVQIAANHARR